MLSSFIAYLILSEETEPACGQDYDWLTYLNSHSNKSTLSIAQYIVDSYIKKINSYVGIGGTLSVSQTSSVNDLIEKFDSWTQIVANDSAAQSVIKDYFVEHAQQYGGPYNDLYSLALNLADSTTTGVAIDELLNAIKNLLFIIRKPLIKRTTLMG
jgi:hypothetical protein